MKIFLSHSFKDKAFVERLQISLEKAGIETWYEKNEILIGNELSSEIKEGISSCEFFLVVLSQHSIANDSWVHLEYITALELQKVILFVLSGNIEIYDLPKGFQSKAFADFRGKDYEAPLGRLLNTILVKNREMEYKSIYDAKTLIEKQRYKEGRNLCEQILDKENESFEARTLIALSILEGIGADRISHKSILKIDQYMMHIWNSGREDIKTWLIIWGLIRYDYYYLQGLPMEEPTIYTLRNRLFVMTDTNIDKSYLEMLNSSSEALDFFRV